ncbi:hypothetical protein GCM10010345_90270 [Streptomyces canarius]|uniref:Uncharacterized protein n=1 Tax=Streptomyces canarius TaxID=285453 RepID=A0ABQ3DDW2_9ACTN|nr:hypothetical protein GCM10010345_90270 [Streptomyces canarius]
MRCNTKFADERWQEIRQSSWPGEWDRLCGPCAQQAADRHEAERHRAPPGGGSPARGRRSAGREATQPVWHRTSPMAVATTDVPATGPATQAGPDVVSGPSLSVVTATLIR